MLEQYTDIAAFFIVGGLFIVVTMIAGLIFRPHNPYPEKLATYECGEIPVGGGQIKFNIRYYIFALIFVVFDVETVFLYPWALILEDVGIFAFVVMLIFIATLVEGLVYAWKKGVLRWV